jgi:hypothetical protein
MMTFSTKLCDSTVTHNVENYHSFRGIKEDWKNKNKRFDLYTHTLGFVVL